jgi:trehalose-phosphatase
MRIAGLLPDAREWRELWQHAQTARRRLLLLDFDGTLSPLVVDRSRAQPLASVVELLDRIAANGTTRVAIVSGRPVEELQKLVSGFSGTLVGEHGWEVQPSGGALKQFELSPTARALLGQAFELGAAIVESARLERKRASLVVHTRGLAPELADAWHLELSEAWFPLLRRAELELRRIDGGWELRARGRTKGSAVDDLAEPAGRPPFVVYLGDDESDEDAFRVIARRGIGFGVRVGGPASHTWAQAQLPDIGAVAELLDLWQRRIESPMVDGVPWKG